MVRGGDVSGGWQKVPPSWNSAAAASLRMKLVRRGVFSSAQGRSIDQSNISHCRGLADHIGDRMGGGALSDRLLEWGPRTVTSRGDLSQAEQSTIKLFQTVSPSVVHVFAQGSEQSSFLDEEREGIVQSRSGIVWDAAGHVVTNYHVIDGASRIGARLTSGEFVAAHLVGVAPNYDLAVLQVADIRSPLRPIAIGRSAELQLGQATFAIGNPYGLEQTLTSGIISALHRRLPTVTSHEISGVIQTDAPINPGNSGGPLLDSAGRLIGVNSAIISKSGASAGIGFAIPVDVVNRIATQLIRDGRVPVPGIGISRRARAKQAEHRWRGHRADLAAIAGREGGPGRRGGRRRRRSGRHHRRERSAGPQHVRSRQRFGGGRR
jgi:S1-C subfamily serine protease